MEKFLKQIEPMIRSRIRQYRRHIRNQDFEDLMQEGYLAALVAVKRWKFAPDKQASLKSWVWIHVEAKFKELSMKSIDGEISLEDLGIEISQEHIYMVWEQPASDDESDDAHDRIKKMLIKAMPKFEGFLEGVIDENLCNLSVAKNMGLTKQRISQINKELHAVIIAK